MIRRIVKAVGLCAFVALVAAQIYRPPHINPPSDSAASFEAVVSPAPEVSSGLRRACGDCHSNETKWPWYSNVAPVSWLVARDVREGRSHLNLSEWAMYGPNMSRSRIGDMCEEVTQGEMPLRVYALLHTKARLSQWEASQLCALGGAGRDETR